MQSPDNFTIMNGLRRTRERRTTRNLRLSTLTFECNHGRVTRAVHCMLPHSDLALWSLCIDEKRSRRATLPLCVHSSLDYHDSRSRNFSTSRGDWMCARRLGTSSKRGPLLSTLTIKIIQSGFYLCYADSMYLWECSNTIFEIAQSNMFLWDYFVY